MTGGELPPPGGIAQHDHQPGTGAVVGGFQRPPERGAGAEQVEEVSRDDQLAGRHWIATALPDDAAERGLVRGEVLERARPRPPVAEVGIGDLEPVVGAAGGIQVPTPTSSAGGAERRRTKQHRLHHAEEGGDRADTQRDGASTAASERRRRYGDGDGEARSEDRRG